MSAFFPPFPLPLELPIKSKWFIFERNVEKGYNIYNKKEDQDIGYLESYGNKNNWVFVSCGKFIYDEKSLNDIIKAIKFLKEKSL
jgi:hypothetical protein